MSQKTREVSRRRRRRPRCTSGRSPWVVMPWSSDRCRDGLSDSTIRRNISRDGSLVVQVSGRGVDEAAMEMSLSFTAGQFVGDDLWVSVLDGGPRQYVDLDTAATSSASVAVTRAVQEFLPWYASVHRGAGIR